MSLTPEIMLLGSLSIPEIIGGAIIGSALRGLRRGFEVNSILKLFWGGLFGFMPLVIGSDEFARTGMLFLFVAQIVVLAGAISVAAFLPTDYFEELKSKNVVMIAVGGLFLLIGLVLGAIMLRSGKMAGILFGLVFGGAGGLVLVFGLKGLFGEK